jgi:hypothetical protein
MACSSKTIRESRNNKLLSGYVKLRVLPMLTVVWTIAVAVWSKLTSVAARLFGLRVRIPLRARMFISYSCYERCRYRPLDMLTIPSNKCNWCSCLIASAVGTSTTKRPSPELGCALEKEKVVWHYIPPLYIRLYSLSSSNFLFGICISINYRFFF